MKKKVLVFALMFVVFCISNVFAYHWLKVNEEWYVEDEATGETMKNTLIDTGNEVYYLDSEGKMVTGWWKNPNTKKIYFFDNNEDGKYGSMVFGLNTIDGYYRYFDNDGSLMVADKMGEYKNVYSDFWADYVGNLYYNNKLMQDVTASKSDYYTNDLYYKYSELNNYYLSNFDTIWVTPENLMQSEIANNNERIITKHGKFDTPIGTSKGNAAGNTSGGTDYYVDESNHIIAPDHTGTISKKEIYGPYKGYNNQ